MGELSTEELDFLRSQKIAASGVFDATGMRKPEYASAMKEAGLSFAFGTTPCGNGGHTLRTRHGHCIQCNTAVIAYQLRHHKPGHVYLAGSAASGLLKIGTTADVGTRAWQLCNWRYGGASDWEMLLTSHVENAGSVEFAAQDKLRDRATAGDYWREGRRQSCYELFRCSYDEARDAVLSAVPANTRTEERNLARARSLWA